MLHHVESDEHFVRRLEGFSDVVIGFSLAQLALSLNIPSQFSALLGNPTWFFAYLWTFSLVCYLWFEHHRMFARIFIPRTVPILLNFGWLATIGLMVYLVQVFIHFQDAIMARTYDLRVVFWPVCFKSAYPLNNLCVRFA
ncbi:MAG: TMEM175 family protein [Candidatus Eremiobacteraeota bacterium]|nr:TMEM175 family protein [Candidatus Eremiobacteraeota bacterium]